MEAVKNSPEQAGKNGKGWVFGMIVLLLSALGLSLLLVWLNVERTDLGYQHKSRLDQISERKNTAEKLDVERERLLSPAVLLNRAKELGLRDARPGQIRRIEQPKR